MTRRCTNLESLRGAPRSGGTWQSRWVTWIASLTLAMTISIPSQSQPSPESQGRTIIEQQKETNRGFGSQITIGQMELIDKGGRVEATREFEHRLLEERGSSGNKSLLKILKPADLAGTALLSWTHKDKADDQWIHLPSLKKTKRIAGTGKTGRFLGSEFTYEDLIPVSIDKYRYRRIVAESCHGTTCDLIETSPLFADSGYSKTILHVRRDTLQNDRIDFYDKKGSLKKVADFSDYRKLNGRFHRPFRVVMKDFSSGRESRFITRKTELEKGLTDDDFTQLKLER